MDIKQFIPMWFRYRLMDIRGRGVYSQFADKYKCIFIHIPKTAGTSIARTLFEQESRHIPYFEYQKANARKFHQYFKFAFVRNPWDRLVSTYFFLKEGGLNELDRKWANEHLNRYQEFEDFVCNGLPGENICSWIHFKPQHYFICDENLVNQMDYVGKFESLPSDFNYICQQLELDTNLYTSNKSEHQHYSKYYTNEMKEIVSKIYADDINTFNYSYDNTYK